MERIGDIGGSVRKCFCLAEGIPEPDRELLTLLMMPRCWIRTGINLRNLHENVHPDGA